MRRKEKLTLLFVVFIDQLIKLLVTSGYGVYVLNDGFAFGLGAEWGGEALVVACVLGFALVFWRFSNTFGYWMVIGGALSNLADRLLYGSVVDYIFVLRSQWLRFNLADASIVSGSLLLACHLFLSRSPSRA